MVRFYLESLVEGGRKPRRVAIHPLPFRVGRLSGPTSSGLALALASDSVSKEHAEIVMQGDALVVRDLGSKNGTFVNSVPVSEARLEEGDILHFAQVEFRVAREEFDDVEDAGLEPPTVSLGDVRLPQQFVEGVRQLPELIASRRVTALFQPIVSLPSGEIAGYEAFGRGCHEQLPELPLELFKVAAAVGAEAELSRLFRETAVELVVPRLPFPALFVNVHPKELATSSLVPDVVRLRERCPQLHLTLEVHERALADRAGVDRLHAQLSRTGIGIAYDDFGAGQARLLELAEVPPHYLKFDMSFVRGIDSATDRRQRLLASLVAVARDLKVWPVAEGVETPEEAEVCMQIGFTHAQGYFYGRPRPIGEIQADR
jgi:EAL domain-containing protein (putative c-di-GMP-specific phosphodiesterase class I)